MFKMNYKQKRWLYKCFGKLTTEWTLVYIPNKRKVWFSEMVFVRTKMAAEECFPILLYHLDNSAIASKSSVNTHAVYHQWHPIVILQRMYNWVKYLKPKEILHFHGDLESSVSFKHSPDVTCYRHPGISHVPSLSNSQLLRPIIVKHRFKGQDLSGQHCFRWGASLIGLWYGTSFRTGMAGWQVKGTGHLPTMKC